MDGVGGCTGISPSPSKRNRGAAELLAAVEFFSDGSSAAQVVRQFSPSKAELHSMSPPQLPLQPAEAMASKLAGGAIGVDSGPGASPTAVADMPAAPSTSSQPSSATSSLAAALADLQVSSRQSSANDLGDRSRLLARIATHSRSASGDDLSGAADLSSSSSSSSSAEGISATAGLTPPLAAEDSLCPPQLIGAVLSFDNLVLKTLTPIKTRSRTTTTTQGGEAGAAADQGASPAAPYADSLVPPGAAQPVVQAEPAALKPKHPVGRPMVYHSRGSSGMQAPGAYNPYDLVTAALSAEFRSPAKSAPSPFPSSTRTTSSTTHTPSQWSASYRANSYRSMVAQHVLMQQKEDEPDFYVSVPGIRRTQSGMSAAASSSCAVSPAVAPPGVGGGSSQPAASRALTPAFSTAAPAAPRSTVSQPGTATGSQRLQRCTGTLGSGTAVHGFKGLFRDIIVTGPAPSQPLGRSLSSVPTL